MVLHYRLFQREAALAAERGRILKPKLLLAPLWPTLGLAGSGIALKNTHDIEH